MTDTLHELEQTLVSRRELRPAGSYSAELFADHERLMRKVMEEAFEVCLELGRAEPDHAAVAAEAADLVYHLLAGLVSVDVSLDSVLAVLERAAAMTVRVALPSRGRLRDGVLSLLDDAGYPAAVLNGAAGPRPRRPSSSRCGRVTPGPGWPPAGSPAPSSPPTSSWRSSSEHLTAVPLGLARSDLIVASREDDGRHRLGPTWPAPRSPPTCPAPPSLVRRGRGRGHRGDHGRLTGGRVRRRARRRHRRPARDRLQPGPQPAAGARRHPPAARPCSCTIAPARRWPT